MINASYRFGNGSMSKSSEPNKFFTLSKTCQIPKLDTYYENYFGKRKTGLFVEIGAYDGEYVSNTSGLADLGWAGHYIEPVEEYAAICQRRHASNNVTVHNLAIGSGSSKTVRITKAGPLSTIKQSEIQNFKRLDWAKSYFNKTKSYNVRLLTLTAFLRSQNIKPESIDLIVIDVEGSEWDVVKGFDIKRYLPHMVIIELHDQNPDYKHLWRNCYKTIDKLESANYVVAYKDLTNTIYVRNR